MRVDDTVAVLFGISHYQYNHGFVVSRLEEEAVQYGLEYSRFRDYGPA